MTMAQAGFSIRPMPVGAEVIGFAEGAENDPVVQKELYDAWLEHGILLFHGVDSVERHLAVSRCFGELEVHPFKPARSEVHPLLIDIGGPKRRRAFVYDDSDIRVNRIPWHRDTAYTPDICKGAMLRMVEVPSQLGETRLCDTAMGYDDLPADVKAKLVGLEYHATLRNHPVKQIRPGAFWNAARPATDAEDPAAADQPIPDEADDHGWPSVVQPALLTHPESGRKCIFLSPTYVDYFLGMEPKESQDLLEYLVDHMLQPKYVYQHRWAVNDAIVWDNRRFMHSSGGNLPDDTRYGLRTTLTGSTRTGRYLDETADPGAVQMAD